MTNYFKSVSSGYVLGIGTTTGTGNITEEEYNTLAEIFRNKPIAEEGYYYKLKDVVYEWELFKREPEPEEE